MPEVIQLGEIAIDVTRKDVKNVHLSVHPPNGRVTLVAPKATRIEVIRAFATSKLGWIRDQQAKLLGQARETPRKYIERESHFLWGRRFLLYVQEAEEKPSVRLTHRTMVLTVRPGSSSQTREDVIRAWYRSQLHEVVPVLIAKWEPILGVRVRSYYLQQMKTKWGSCNYRSRSIRLNTELAKKPKDLLEYVLVHEMLHLIEPTHSRRFVELLDKYYPMWRESRVELNELPLASGEWDEP